MDLSLQRAGGVAWSVRARALPGEPVSGDEHVVAVREDGGVLVAVIDGLGHGGEATRAARCAAEVVTANPNDPLVALMQRCHAAMRDTRGAAMTLLALDARTGTATALGVGNVEAVLVRSDPRVHPARENVLLRNGVVGYQLPPLQPGELRIGCGDLFVLATDGLREDFGDRLVASEPLDHLVERLLAENFRGTDDGLVLACRILGDDEG